MKTLGIIIMLSSTNGFEIVRECLLFEHYLPVLLSRSPSWCLFDSEIPLATHSSFLVLNLSWFIPLAYPL